MKKVLPLISQDEPPNFDTWINNRGEFFYHTGMTFRGQLLQSKIEHRPQTILLASRLVMKKLEIQNEHGSFTSFYIARDSKKKNPKPGEEGRKHLLDSWYTIMKNPYTNSIQKMAQIKTRGPKGNLSSNKRRMEFAQPMKMSVETVNAARVAKDTIYGVKSNAVNMFIYKKKKEGPIVQCGGLGDKVKECQSQGLHGNYCGLAVYLEKACKKEGEALPKTEITLNIKGYKFEMELDTSTTDNILFRSVTERNSDRSGPKGNLSSNKRRIEFCAANEMSVETVMQQGLPKIRYTGLNPTRLTCSSTRRKTKVLLYSLKKNIQSKSSFIRVLDAEVLETKVKECQSQGLHGNYCGLAGYLEKAM
ncbi:unnamed protein product [Lepeophtheirus salmonis]|uniref:(salmon louse) hypothetical protein n=1 Tax=Lepeophtheirus salmonis TaxID=72036 RepID=A0A7R8D213_LEPSM|nr:unnamed protein product [Lepeophtheirus salmonis]CAF3000235.1 unnamed protein product [Lepeophtheirus salmonis]